MQALRSNSTVMIGLAVVFGGAAVFLARSWLINQADRANVKAQASPVAMNTLVVASQPLRFGAAVEASSLKEIPWPADSVPDGAFAKIDEITAEGKRVVLAAMEPFEPVLKTKITGAGQRATLAALVGEGLRAVTVRVNDVNGVAGFVLPGDRVDIVMTQNEGTTGGTADMVLQNVRVLAIDQSADDKTDQPSVVKAVTLEVTTSGAQKVSLASSLGQLSLFLRRAGDTASMPASRVTLADILRGDAPAIPFQASAPRDLSPNGVTVRVNRSNNETKEYTVPVEPAR